MWVISATPLVFSLAKSSSDFNRLLFDKELGDLAQFYDWDFRNNLKFTNASQPYTPHFTQIGGTLVKQRSDMSPSINSSLGGNRLQGILKASQNEYASQEEQIFTILASQSDGYGSMPGSSEGLNSGSMAIGEKEGSEQET